MTRIKRFTVFRRKADSLTTHNSDQKNAPSDPQFEGVIFTDGSVCVRWLTARKSHSVWSSLEDLLAIHGHPEYGTEIHWHDGDEPAVWTQMCEAAGVARADTPQPIDMQLRIAELECEILRRDKARMDWLESRWGRIHRNGNGFVFVEVNGRFAGGKNLRDAVDCAIDTWGTDRCE